MKKKCGLRIADCGVWLCLMLCLALGANTVWAQATGVARVNDAAASSSLVTEFEVNGLKVLFKRRAGSQSVATGLFIRGGARNITAENAGLEDMMLDVATEGSVGYPRSRMRTELARTGSAIGSGADYDYSVLSLGTTRQAFERSWDVFADVVLHPAFAPEDFGLVKERALSALRDNQDSPDAYLEKLQEAEVYAGHPYANSPNGTVESISRLKLEDLRAYHKKIMETSRLLLVVVGDLDAAMLQAKVAATLGTLPRGNYVSTPTPPLEFKEPSVNVTLRALPTNYIQGAFTAPSLDSPDYYAMRVARSILHDRVYEEVRTKRNLSYAPSAFFNVQGASLGGVYVTAVDANQSVRLMLDEIERLQTELVSDYEIASTSAQTLTNYYLDQETNAAQARELARYELLGNGWRNSFELLARIRAVTPADVRRVSLKYMRNLRFVVIGDPHAIDRKVFTRKLGQQ